MDATTLDQYYDANGNMIQRYGPVAGNDRAVKYSASNQAYEITTDTGARQRFWYGAGGARYKSEDGAKKTLYLGNVEIVTDGGVVTTRRTIAGVMLQTIVGATATNYYLFHDQLGSLVRIANAAGAAVSQMDFLAFGGRRNTDTQAANGTASSLTPRGFTGHEMLDSVGLIHMNGRIYDFYLGRFLQPDPLIQAPGNAQSWNAYTYVFNNPLIYTDPTGNFSLRQFLGIVIAVVAAVFQQYYISKAALGAAFAVGVADGFLAGYVASGTLKGGLTGAFTAGLTFGVGIFFWGGGAYIQMAAQAVTGGILESLQGGSFGHGFAVAGLTAAFMPQVGKIGNDVIRTTVGALVGGTISKVTGGKFANGAISGAIQGAMSGRKQADKSTDAESDAMCGMDNPAIPGGFGIGDQPADSGLASTDVLSLPGVRAGYDAVTGEFFAEGVVTIDGFQSAFAARNMTSAWTFSGQDGGIHYRSDITFVSVASGGDIHVAGVTTLPPTAFGRMQFGSRTMELNRTIWKTGLFHFSVKQVRVHFASVVGHEFGHGLRLAHMFPGSGALMSYDCGRSAGYYEFRGIYRAAGGVW